MMAMAEPPSSSSFLPLLESLEDGAAGQSEQTDAYLTIANRLSGEEGRQFLPAVEKHFSRLGKATLVHINSPNAELSQAALQALGFCLYHSHVVSRVSETFAAEILSALCSLVVKSTDKNTCTRALWVISKQSFPPEVVSKKVPSILGALESVWSREDIQSVVMEHEALNVIIRMLEQVPAPMGDGAVRWAKLIIPLVVHSASKVRLRAAAAMEMGMPLLLEKQVEVAAIIEPIMSSKLIPELQKLFMSKNETNVLKLWPLFVKLLGKLLHRGGPFINSLLHLEELGFRSSSPTIKKIAFIAWKSLIDNFALNPDILCSSKRMKLLMQPLASIHVRTEALLLTKVEVWWYLVVQLGPNLSTNFDQVSVPLLQCTIGSDSSSVPGSASRAVNQNGAVTPGTPKTGTSGFSSSTTTPRMSLNSSIQVPPTFPSIQLLGLEMLLHYFLGPEVNATAAKNKLVLNLEPLNLPFLSGASSFTKHAAVLTSNIRDGFINVGRDAPDPLLAVIWTNLVRCVNVTIESGSKKDRQGCEVLTLMLQALQSIITSDAVPADKVLILFEATVKGLPQRVLGSASYQVGKMDVLNGTPALFLILLLYNSSMLSAYIEDERFFQCLQTLVGCGLSGPTSPLAFGEAVLAAIRRSAGSVHDKERLWMMWSVMVSPLTDTITQSNEVNQGDALEHNFSAMHSALLFPVTHLLRGAPLQQAAQKSMLSSWSKLYKVFARCSALVVTAEENICCEELCAKMTAAIDREALTVPSTLNAVASFLQVVVECVDFSPYTPQFQQKMKSPHTPVNWMKKRNKVLGNLSTFQSLLVQCLEVYLEGPLEASSEATGLALVAVLSTLFSNLVLANTVKEALTSLIQPLTLFYEQAASELPKFTSQLLGKLEKLLGEVLGCLQTRSALAYNDELLALLSPLLCVLFPHKNKQLRSSVAQFWNSTFANSVSLAYPDEIRPILSQVKQKTPIILPGFEVVGVPDELSGQYSSESSQLETKLSGMPVSSVGKRDSLLGKAAELKDRSATKTSKPVSTRLDFGSPKPPRRAVLEEEASIDFVFIPPETKERVLTEHQKEVKRTKRVDIPAMYNNLDASLDTTVFTQYTQSQEESSEKLPTEAEEVTKEASGKVLHEDVENEEDIEILTKATQDFTSPQAVDNKTENHEQEEMIPESADVSMEDDAKSDDRAEDLDMQSKEGTSPNISGSSDLVSGTPQKPNSRRQSFITLEKYAEGKPASPSSASTFTGPLIKTSNSQERSGSKKTSSSRASRTSTGPNSQDSQSTQTGKMNSQCPVNDALESPRRPKDSRTKSEPIRLTERLPSDATEDEDVIPDTQAQVEAKESTEMASALEEMKPSSQEEKSKQTLDDSQSSGSQTSPGEPRRSGRCRVRPLLPGEAPEEQEEKFTQFKKKRSGEEPKSESPKSSSVHSRPNTRSKQAAEEDGGRDRLRTRAQRDKSESSQTNSQGRAHKKIKMYSNSEDFLDKPEPRRRRTREHESSQTGSWSDPQSDYESQSQGTRHSRRSKSSLETKEEGGMKKKVLLDKEESSQTSTHELVEQIEKHDDKPKRDSQTDTPSPQTGGKSQEFELVEQTGKDGDELKKDSQMDTPSPQTGGKSQEFELVEQTGKDGDKTKKDSQMISPSLQSGGKSQEFEKTKKEKGDSQIVASSPTNDESQDRKSATNKLVNEIEVKDKRKTREGTDDNLSQEDSQVITSSSSDSQSLRRSRRSKASEAAETEDKSQNKDSGRRQSRSNSQAALSAVGQPEAGIGGRTRRSKVQEEQSKSSPSSTPESSQSLDIAGSTESSQGRGRYSRRRSSLALVANIESSESESSEAKENSPVPKKRGRKPRVSLQSPLTLESKEDKINKVKDGSDASQQADTQSTEAQNTTDFEDSQETQDLEGSESLQVTRNIEEQSNEESPMEVEVDAVVHKTETDDTKSKALSMSPRKEEQRQKDSDTNISNASSQESDDGGLQPAEMLESVGISPEQTQEKLPVEPSVVSAVDTLAPPDETTEKLQASESSGTLQVSESSGKLQVSESSGTLQVSESSGTLQVSESSGKLQVSESSGTLQVSESSGKLQVSESSGTLQVSESSGTLQVSESSGKLQVSESSGTLQVSESSGKLQVSESSGTLQVSESSGKLQVSESSGTLQVSESSGTLQVSESSGKLQVSESSGKLQVSESSGTLQVSESSGTLQVSESSGTLQVSESSGKLQVSESSGTLQASESSGKLQVSESSEEKAEVSEPVDSKTEKQNDDSDSNHQEHPVVPVEDAAEDTCSTSFGQNQMECPDVIDDVSKEEEESATDKEDQSTNEHTEVSASDDSTPPQESDIPDSKSQSTECQHEEEPQTANAENDVVANLDAALADASALSESTSKYAFTDSPVKQKDLEAVMGIDVIQSPSSGRTRGTWSPSASPSTSILKKGQKRPLEDETPSPLVKSRRVSFADPIQHQEIADDIDRRSPAIRTSSPRRSKVTNIPQPQYVTTPTKGLLVFSPRNLHSPGYKSSKKCLISEMSQEPRPVSRDCIYPALVGCSAPVEAVLPQISSNMWSRGFGQLVRARNIKTVGDLSALTPTEIKTLPIRSPKISNVKKALKTYEQQRKGRGVDELKSFDDMEMMASELEETSARQNQDEEDKTSGETLATELVDEPVSADGRPEPSCSGNPTPEQRPEGHPGGLPSEVEALACRMTPLELGDCSPQQLVQMHDQLGGMMSRVVAELQKRLCQTDGKP